MFASPHAAVRVALVVGAALPLLAVTATLAQHERNAELPTVTVVRVASLAQGAGAVVQRGGTPTRNLILVTASTATGDLAAALAVLADSRRRNGEEAVTRLLVRIPAGQRPAPSATLTDRLARELDRLRAAGPRPVEGFGTVPAIVIPLTPLSRSGLNDR